MLVYIHIPKNAGTTMNAILKYNFRERHTEFYTHRQGNFLSETEFIEFIQRIQSQTDVLCGHDIVPLEAERSKLLGLKYFTFIRHPVNRAISLYYHEKKVTIGTEHCSQLPFSVYVTERPKENNAITNWQVYNIAGKADYNRAIRLLDQFLMVGLVEQFDKSLILLRKRLCNTSGFSHFRIVYKRMNVSQNRQVTLKSLPQNIRDRLIEMNQEDLKLFEYAKRRLNEELQYIPHVAYKTLLLKVNNIVFHYWPSVYDYYARK